MDKKQKQRLINALKGAGMSEGLVSHYEGIESDALDKVIEGLEKAGTPAPDMSAIVASDAFSEFMSNGGFDKMLAANKSAQSIFDSKMSKGANTRLQNWLESNGMAPQDPKPETKVDVKTDDPAMKQMLELVQSMKSEMDGLKNQLAAKDKMGGAKDLISKSKLPAQVQELWLSRISVDSETTIEDQIKALEKEHELLTGKPLTDEDDNPAPGTYGLHKGGNNGTGKKLSKADADALAAFAGSVQL
jgi:hypothetical protein